MENRKEKNRRPVGGVKAVAQGKAGPLKPFKPVRVKGKPVSELILEDRR